MANAYDVADFFINSAKYDEKKEVPLDNFSIPKYFYDTAYCGKRNDDGILILPKEFDEE